MLKLELRHLGALLDALAGQGKVYAPFRQGGRTDFAWYDGTAGRDAAALDLEHHTARAPKDILFPRWRTCSGSASREKAGPGSGAPADGVRCGLRRAGL